MAEEERKEAAGRNPSRGGVWEGRDPPTPRPKGGEGKGGKGLIIKMLKMPSNGKQVTPAWGSC